MQIMRSIRRRLTVPKPAIGHYVSALRRLWKDKSPPPDRVIEAARDLDTWFKRMGTKGAELRLPYGSLSWRAHPSDLRSRVAKIGQAVIPTV